MTHPIAITAPGPRPVEIQAPLRKPNENLAADFQAALERSDSDAVGYFAFAGVRFTLQQNILRIAERDAAGNWVEIERTDYSADSPIAAPAQFIEMLQFIGKRALMRACGMTREAVAPARLTWKARVGKVWKTL